MLKNFLKITLLLIIFPFATLAKDAKTKDLAQYQTYESEEEFDDYKSENEFEIYDPFEKYNRKIYAFNDTLDRYFLEHVAKAYRVGFHPKIRSSIRNFLTNLTLPLSAANSLLQGKLDNGLATFSNFLINSTIGLGGIFDVAGNKGIKYKPEDFGQTLGHYGSGSGAYLMIPLLGPSSNRDFSGWIVDKSVDPIGFNALKIDQHDELLKNEYRFGIAGASAIDTREKLIDIIDGIREDSFDPYATIRSAYLQKRISEIKN